jgi:hypothetical protein
VSRRALAALFAAAALAGAAGPAAAAFESPGPDPRPLALGGAGPAWPFDRGAVVSPGACPVFGAPPPPGAAAAALRWEAAPGLAHDGVVAWTRLGGSVLSLHALRLGLAPYAETTLALGAARPAAGLGWGWSLAAGREAWSAGAAGESGWIVQAQLGFAPRAGVRTAIRLVERFGHRSGARGGLELGASADPVAGWRLGAGYETARAGGLGRLKLGVECLAARAVTLRMGFVPAESAFSTGVGCRIGFVSIDAARRAHPRLGAMQALSFRLGGGGS